MRWLIITSVLMVPGVSEAAVTFSEIAWMGTSNSANDEWIELHNDGSSTDVAGWTISDGMNLEIILEGFLSSGEYGVLERTDDDSAPGTAFQIYTGSLPNTGATLTLRDASDNMQDQVSGGENWENIGGDNTTKETAQYTSGGWITAVATPGSQNATESSVIVEESDDDDNTDSETKTVSKSSSGNKTTTTKLELKDSVLELALEAPTRAYVNQLIDFSIEPSGIARQLMPSITYDWNFGDFNEDGGQEVQHSYAFPGTYVVFVEAGYARHEATIRHEITVLPVNFSITRTRQGDVQINNDAKYEIDLSNYQIQARNMVVIPENTILLPGATLTITKELIRAEIQDLIVLSDTEGVILATNGMSKVSPPVALNEQSLTVSPVNLVAPIAAPPSQDFQFPNEPKSTTIIETPDTPLLLTGTTAPQGAQLQQSAASSIPNNSLPYFALAGVLALGFLGIFAGRIRTG